MTMHKSGRIRASNINVQKIEKVLRHVHYSRKRKFFFCGGGGGGGELKERCHKCNSY